jgi:formylglycine-generating enzyme required for sulfatase activity
MRAMTQRTDDLRGLRDAAEWHRLSSTEQDRLVAEVVERVGGGFKKGSAKTYDKKDPIRIASVIDSSTGIVFNVVPGGSFLMGLSDEEFEALQENDTKGDVEASGVDMRTLRPVHRVAVPPFLLARFPLLHAQCSELIALDDEDGRPEFEGRTRNIPIYLNQKEIGRVLKKTGYRLPSEAEREYACRAGTTSLFYFGNRLTRPLEKTACLVDYSSEDRNDKASNRYGLVGLGVADLCADTWHSNYKGAPEDAAPWSEKGPRVVRGGAAALYPWQNGEWLLLMSAMRVRLDHMYEGMSGVRFAISIED